MTLLLIANVVLGEVDGVVDEEDEDNGRTDEIGDGRLGDLDSSSVGFIQFPAPPRPVWRYSGIGNEDEMASDGLSVGKDWALGSACDCRLAIVGSEAKEMASAECVKSTYLSFPFRNTLIFLLAVEVSCPTSS